MPRPAWPKMSSRDEFSRSGIYVLVGSGEGEAVDLPTVYVGQGEEIGTQIESHFGNKDFLELVLRVRDEREFT